MKKLKSAYKIAGNLWEFALKGVSFSKGSWGDIHEVAFIDLIETTSSSKEQLHYIYIFGRTRYVLGGNDHSAPTDWSNKNIMEQGQETLTILGQKISIQGKLVYIWQGNLRDQKVARHNLIIVVGVNYAESIDGSLKLAIRFRPLTLPSNTARYMLEKIHRGAIHLSWYKLAVAHIEGSNNVFAELFKRWSKRHRLKETTCSNVCLRNRSLVPNDKTNHVCLRLHVQATQNGGKPHHNQEEIKVENGK